MDEALLTKLRELGLSERESRVLLSLYLKGSSRASSLARHTGISRIETYRILKGLQDKGLVEASFSNPVTFSALPINAVCDSLMNDLSEKMKVVNRTKKELVSQIGGLSKAVDEAGHKDEPKYRIIRGRKHLYSTLVKMFNSANSYITFFINKDGLGRLYYSDAFEALARASRRKVSVKGLVEIDSSSIRSVENYLKFAEIRHAGNMATAAFFVIDNRELLMSAEVQEGSAFDSNSSIALWTN